VALRDSIIGALGGKTEDPDYAGIRDQLRAADIQVETLQESFAQLELALEEQGWRRFGASYQNEFTRGALENLINISQTMYMVNPLIKRAVNVKTYYTWGQGVEVEAKDQRIQDEVIEPMTTDDGNEAEFYSHQARILTHVDQQLEGNQFFRLPTDMMGNVSVRSVPTNEIRDIHCKPGDPQTVWFYRRAWTEDEYNLTTGETEHKTYDVLYPDFRFDPINKPDQIGDKRVIWDEPIIHQKTGGLKHMQFGIPEVYAVLDWARAYKRFLEDWHTIVRSLSEFAWKRTTSAEKIAQEKQKFESRRRTSVEGEEHPHDDPLRRRAAGAVAISTEQGDLVPISKSGATVGADDARPSRLMVAAGMDLPDTILSGDVDIGNFATSKTLDRPTELGMVNEQLMWKRFDQKIFDYAVKAKVKRGFLPGTRTRSLDGTRYITEYGGDSSEVMIKFPPVLEHDIKEVITSITAAATLEGRADAGTLPREEMSKQMMSALGWDDIDELVKELPDQDQQDLLNAVKALQTAVGNRPEEQPPGGDNGGPPQGDQPPAKAGNQ